MGCNLQRVLAAKRKACCLGCCRHADCQNPFLDSDSINDLTLPATFGLQTQKVVWMGPMTTKKASKMDPPKWETLSASPWRTSVWANKPLKIHMVITIPDAGWASRRPSGLHCKCRALAESVDHVVETLALKRH